MLACSAFIELGNKMLTLSPMENLIVQCNQMIYFQVQNLQLIIFFNYKLM